MHPSFLACTRVDPSVGLFCAASVLFFACCWFARLIHVSHALNAAVSFARCALCARLRTCYCFSSSYVVTPQTKLRGGEDGTFPAFREPPVLSQPTRFFFSGLDVARYFPCPATLLLISYVPGTRVQATVLVPTLMSTPLYRKRRPPGSNRFVFGLGTVFACRR